MNVVLSTLLTIALTSITDAGTGTEPSMESAPAAPSADVDPDRQNPMLGFSRLVGGAWKIGPLRHVFEWGIARGSVISRSYDAEGKLAADGSKSDYTGRWEFTTEDSYDWTLYNRTDEGLVEAMSMTAKRVND